MATTRLLWQLCGDPPVDPGAWTQGLALHIRYSPLTTIAMRIGTEQRSYVLLHSCGHCLRNACAIGCPTSLFRRLVHACLPNGQLQPVPQPQGLAIRPYTHAVLCWPMAGAQPLTAELLEPWSESRLMVHWGQAMSRPCVGGLLMTTAETPMTPLRDQGWRAIPLPRQSMRWLNRQVLPLPIPGVPWPGDPFVLHGHHALDIGKETTDGPYPAATS